MSADGANETLTAVEGFRVGHWTHPNGRTGCTVVLCPPDGCVASGVVLGGSPASREGALLAPDKLIERVHAVTLSGGSAFGLDSASGVVRWLEEQGVGHPTPGGRVPLVPTACIYDLEHAGGGNRPGAESGYHAAATASPAPVARGRVGAAAGATASVYQGYASSARTGLGSSALQIRGATVAALAVANPLGDIRDPRDGSVIVGHGRSSTDIAEAVAAARPGENTTLVIVATDARLTKTQCAQLSTAAHIGIARVIHPSHTPFDGDSTFVLSTGVGPDVPIGALAVVVQEVVARAVIDAGEQGRAA